MLSPGPPSDTGLDPRMSSTQSLVPSVDGAGEFAGDDPKRRLLVVYIHGFMGNKTSFGSFPAHVHAFLKDLLIDTHVIHTKIYPRYKTYKSIDLARDNFSKWLAPHESPTTDVVLVGHSMGGLLAAEVVLLPQNGPYSTASPLRHRILGTVSLDAPLLGLHPGIVVSGIASLFRPAPSPTKADQDNGTPQDISPEASIYSEISSLADVPSPDLTPHPSSSTGSLPANAPDPLFDPPFFNDVAFVDRGWLRNLMHFANKHKEENLFRAAAGHIVSHLEFGGCLSDYSGLKSRYNRLRRLEDVDELHPPSGEKLVRVRFVNYYTVSTGVVKKPKSRETSPDGVPQNEGGESETTTPGVVGSALAAPRISVEEFSDDSRRESLVVLDPMPEPDPPDPSWTPSPTAADSQLTHETSNTTKAILIHDHPSDDNTYNDASKDDASNNDPNLPDIPSVPSPPSPPDLDALPDKESQKQAQKAFKLAQKEHAQAIKAREKALKARQKVLDKQEKEQRRALKKAAQSRPQKPTTEGRGLSEDDKNNHDDDDDNSKPPEEKDRNDDTTSSPTDHHNPRSRHTTSQPQDPPQPQTNNNNNNNTIAPAITKKKKTKKFCLTPNSGTRTHNHQPPDPTWVPIHMEGVDEVGAHCGLFVPTAPHYEALVGDVGARIAEWVGEDASRRWVLLLEAEEEEGRYLAGGGDGESGMEGVTEGVCGFDLD